MDKETKTMMESEYSPGFDATPPPPSSSEDDFAFNASSHLDDLDLSLALDDGGEDGGVDSTVPAAVAADDDVDPWAVLAAAAGEDAPPPPPSPAVVVANDAETAAQASLAHAEGEVFAMPGLDSRASAAPLLASIAARIHEVDEQVGISARVRTLDDRYHIAERLAHLNDDVLRPAVAGTIERTREVVVVPVREKVAPAVKEGWEVVRERAADANVGERWSSISAAASSVAAGTATKLVESVARLKEELDVKQALANATAGDDNDAAGRGSKWQELPNIGDAKDKVVEGWTGGVNWLQRRIQEARAQQVQQQNQQDYSGGGGGRDPALTRLDSYGLPSSFQRD